MRKRDSLEIKSINNGDIFVYNISKFGKQAFMLAFDKLVCIESGQILEIKDLIYSVMEHYMIEDENDIYIEEHIKFSDNEVFKRIYGE